MKHRIPCLTFLLLSGLSLLTLPGFAQPVVGWADTSLFSSLKFRNLGPTRGGRATAVTGVIEQPEVYFLGSTGGGLWKTTDYGQSWRNVSDGYFASPSIGAVRVAPSNPKIVYVGTGSDGLRSNVIAGKGVYKSLDAGKTWKSVGLEKTGHIGAVEIHPENPDVVFVAAIGQAFNPNPERGLFRSRDGGKSWEKVLFLSDTTGIADVEFHPSDPSVLYAAAWRAERKPWTIISGGKQGGVFRSTDGGSTWQASGKGLPSSLIGKIDLAVSPGAPDRVYALVEAPGDQGGLYRSDDRGETWRQVSNKKQLLDRPFYYCNVDVNPQNADAVYVNSTSFWYSPDGGKNWKTLRTPHGDNHDIWINPKDTLLWVQCNDGGGNVSRDGGRSWSTQDNQPTAELYQVEVDDQYPYWLYAGQQDNTTIALPSLPPYPAPAGNSAFWLSVGGCETGPAVPKPGNPNIVFSNCKGCFSVYDKRTGQERNYFVGATYIYGHNPRDLAHRFQRVAPIHVSPHDPNVVYHASQFLHRSSDEGVTWETISPDLTANEPDKQVISGSPITRDVTGEEYYSTIYEIQESRLERGLIWIGANDGPVHLTRDGGKTWTNVTPAGLAPGGRVDGVESSPHQAGKAYVAILRYQLGDWRPYAYKTQDYGRTWTLLTDGANGIPADNPVRIVREDPSREGLLYAGTENGLYLSFDDGRSWLPFQRNLPITPITDIKVVRGDLVLSTMGRGFWVLDNLAVLHQLSASVARNQAYLFQPPDQYRFRYRGAAGVPEYPAPRAIFDYYLASEPKSDIKLEIFDQNQRLLRSFTSTQPKQQAGGEGEAPREEPDMATGYFTPGFGVVLKKTPGQHRVFWDMRHPGPWDRDSRRSGMGGPLAAPGRYTVRLTVDGQELEQSFQLLMDPRVAASGISVEAIKEQEELALRVIELESQAKRLANALRNERDAGAKKEKPGEKNARNSSSANQNKKQEEILAQIEGQLITPEGRYMQPRLVEQVRYLRDMLEGSDQQPGRDAYQRYDQLKQQLNQLIAQWQRLSGQEAEFKQLD